MNVAKQSEVAEMELLVGKLISKVKQMRVEMNIEMMT